MSRLLALAFVVGCNPVEAIDAPSDLAAPGAPVGVRTVTDGELSMEIWYPARENTSAETEDADFTLFLSDEFFERLGGDVSIPLVPTLGVRDAKIRRGPEPWPVLVFSHGFAGNRLQSTDLTVHLASRGYVVVAPDHWGRHTSELLPCLFDPALDDCDLSGFTGDDPAPDQIEEALDWVVAANASRKDPFFERLDLERLGLFGHSAGGQTTAAFGDEDERFDVLMPMAGSAPVDRDVPTLNMAGTCDGVVTPESIRESHDASTQARWLSITDAGHHAFSDICLLDLAGLAETHLQGRDDVNDTFLDAMLELVADGCPGQAPTLDGCDTFSPLEPGFESVRWYGTAWFDHHLKDGPDLEGGLFEVADLEP
ncbi:MAG: dienelactone hydrolase family protein [Proteobacteria bacterium]|nr:dienelactone hydrolase family protein [Pseudomonadota bacterium]